MNLHLSCSVVTTKRNTQTTADVLLLIEEMKHTNHLLLKELEQSYTELKTFANARGINFVDRW